MYTNPDGLLPSLGGDILLMPPLGGEIRDTPLGLVSDGEPDGLYTSPAGFAISALDLPLPGAFGICSLLRGGLPIFLPAAAAGFWSSSHVSSTGGGDREPLEVANLGRFPSADGLRNLLPSDFPDPTLDLDVMLDWLVLMLRL